MPPRRSCFLLGFQASGLVPEVSMPPRRSCFPVLQPGGFPVRSRFNATTAFLLPSVAGMSVTHVPRFQCHHGVPASRVELSASYTQVGAFQCHHGVPASPPSGGRDEDPVRVSMPPRRSCFSRGTKSTWPGSPCFNATTAFLLPYNDVRDLKQSDAGFNATTAFLLPTDSATRLASSWGFNATTAFLLRWSAIRVLLLVFSFQCHHGVPASPDRVDVPGSLCRFQCHHGVPASGVS